MNKKDLIKFLMESDAKYFYLEDLCAITFWDRSKMVKFLDWKNFKSLTNKFNNKWQWSYEWWQNGRRMNYTETFGFNIRFNINDEEIPEGIEKRIKIFNKQHLDTARAIDLELLNALDIKYKWNDHFYENEDTFSTYGEWTYKLNRYEEAVPEFSNNLDSIVSLLKDNNVEYTISVNKDDVEIKIGKIRRKGQKMSSVLCLTYIESLNALKKVS